MVHMILDPDSSMNWKGVQPSLLKSQVWNAIPFARDPNGLKPSDEILSGLPYLQHLWHTENQEATKSRSKYFELALSAHWATVGSFVPTDLDVTIRQKIWSEATVDETTEMTKVVLDALKWNDQPLSNRWAKAKSGALISGHQGEWFTVAIPAWWKGRHNPSDLRKDLETAVLEMLSDHKENWDKSIGAPENLRHKICAALAHNMGDFKRIWTMWRVPGEESEFVRSVERQIEAAWLEPLGKLYQLKLADENHRHLALREPRVLRTKREFLLPFAPFYFPWGKKVGVGLEASEVATVVEALVSGWFILFDKNEQSTFAYPAAVAGILETLKGGLRALQGEMPVKTYKKLSSGPFWAKVQSVLRFPAHFE